MASQKIEEYHGRPLYVRLKNAPEIFGFEVDTLKKVAVEARAFRKVSNMALINISKMEDYIETFEAFD